VTPDVARQAAALRAAAAFIEAEGLPGLRVTAAFSALFIEVPRALGAPDVRTGLVTRLAGAAGAPALRIQPGAWQETVTATGDIGGHRAVITTVIDDEEDEEAGATA
jgi:hypothetical protein